MSDETTLEEYKEAWKEMELREVRRDRIAHATAYVIVNAFLIFVNLWTSPERIWSPWP